MFTIQKDLNGIFWHIYNNARTRVNVSDFDVVIDDVSNTFIIQCKNGSNIPNQAISISLIQVIDLSVGTSPILFSGANGLIQLLTAKGYTPYLQVPPSVSVVVYRVGQVGVFTMTPTQFTDNFTETGLGTNTMLGWALRNGNNGTKNQQGKFSLNKGVSPYDVIGTLGGSANSVLIGHDHESAVFSNGRKGVNDTGTGGTFNGNVLVEAEANQKIVKTSIKGQSNTGADVPSEDGVGKNMPPYLIDVWVERVTELVINSGSGSGVISIVAGTNITVDDSDPQNPIVSASGGGSQTLAQTLAEDNKTNDIAIASNNGKGRIYVNDDALRIEYKDNYLILEPTLGLLLYSDIKVYTAAPYMEAVADYTISYTCPSFLLNSEEVATQNWVTSQGYGTTPTLAETLAIDNKTNDIPIVSNNGNGYAYVNDEQTVIGNDLGGAKRIIMNEDSFDIITPVRIIIDGKGLHLDTTTDGLGLPRLTTTQMNAIVLPTDGMIVWNTTESETYQYNGATWNALSGGTVDSVNGQTGVVVLDAADVGADAITSATTGAVISFATPQIYNSIASPSSSNLTDNLTGARIGIVQKIYHNAGTAPTVPAGWVLRGTGAYVTSTLNIIYAEWSVGTTVEYWITQ